MLGNQFSTFINNFYFWKLYLQHQQVYLKIVFLIYDIDHVSKARYFTVWYYEKKQWVAKHATELNRVVLLNIQTWLKAAVLQTVKTGKKRLRDTILPYPKK